MKLAWLPLFLAACQFNVAAEHCPGCTILTRKSSAIPAGHGPALVVLIGGAFGFGDEWDPVVAELRAESRPFVVFAWPGPWRERNLNARALVSLLQGALASPSLERLLVLAHSAGGQLAGWAVRQLDVPPGKQVLLAAIAAPQPMNYATYHPETEPNTPLGVPLGGTQRDIPPIPPRVVVVEYLTEDAPSHPRPGAVYLGARTSHGGAVAAAGLPLLRALSRSGDLWYR